MGDICRAPRCTGRLREGKCFMKQPIDPINMETLDRGRAQKIVHAVRQWADEQINGPMPS